MSARDDFAQSIGDWEGRYRWMYLDHKGLVTVGVGFLIDSVSAAQAMPFEKESGDKATAAEIEAAWHAVKRRTDLAGRKGAAARFEGITNLRLPEAEIDRILSEKVAKFEAALRQLFPEFNSWPDDAQLATLDMAFAMGVGRIQQSYKEFTKACRARDWRKAGNECTMKGGRQSRNDNNAQRFRNAAAADPGKTNTGGKDTGSQAVPKNNDRGGHASPQHHSGPSAPGPTKQSQPGDHAGPEVEPQPPATGALRERPTTQSQAEDTAIGNAVRDMFTSGWADENGRVDGMTEDEYHAALTQARHQHTGAGVR